MTKTLLVTPYVLCALSALGCASSTTAPEPSVPGSEPAPVPPAEGPGTVGEPPATEPAPAEAAPAAGGACTTDSDCVPAGCCHATACVAKGSAPDCSTMMCTKECRGGTLDCGGHCLCQNGTCAAQLNSM